jgi:hypothetical protein
VRQRNIDRITFNICAVTYLFKQLKATLGVAAYFFEVKGDGNAVFNLYQPKVSIIITRIVAEALTKGRTTRMTTGGK